MALDLGKQIGPMPLGAWLAVVGTGLGIAVWTRSTSAPASDGSDSTSGGGLTTDGGLVGEDGVGVGPGWVAVPPPTTAPVAPVPQDNDEWGRLAINTMIADGYDPGLVQSAIAHALQGSTMSVREFAIWTIALGKLGAPPYPVDVVPPTSTPGPVTPTPTPPNPTPPSSGRWYRITSPNMTLRKVSALAYRTQTRWDDIYNANRVGVRRPDGSPGFIPARNRSRDALLPVGRRLWLPR